MAKQTISIIGAGLGGLTLGRCLQKRGISAVLYERTSSAAPHNHGITLYASSFTPLLRALDVSEKNFKNKVAVDAATGGQGSINHSAAGFLKESGQDDTCFHVHRGRLEEWLREGLDIRWEHVLQNVEPSSGADEQPTVHFENGLKTQTNVVIGADGPHSAMRRSILPDSQLIILPFVAFNGKRRIDRAVFEDCFEPHLNNTNVVQFTQGDVRLKLSIDDNYSKDKVSVSWTYSRPSHPNGPLSQLLDTKDVRKDRLLHWLMRTILLPKENLQDLAHGGIVLLGDAVHAEPIVGGNGANAAIQDAVSLANRIAGGQETDKLDLSSWIDERYGSWEHGVRTAKTTIDATHSHQNAKI
ncbi:FAD/NAD(P)-binding domain-containing protein [Setomelanomma holmii]|uniref:FAD/NAD(P)-binding domain-containing protein n=1 Tax=Setomelanomma holmii TaxID=210430 RepID=A0A9P4LPY3_9PLEO|nr:FAD/NAD(P)-binding domain-containing protein [Setomelanomma holmii]